MSRPKFCPECGNRLGDVGKFCNMCGWTIVDPNAAQQAPGQYQQAPGQYQQAPGQNPQAPGQYQQAPGQYQQMPGQYQQMPGQYPQAAGQYQQAAGQYQPTPIIPPAGAPADSGKKSASWVEDHKLPIIIALAAAVVITAGLLIYFRVIKDNGIKTQDDSSTASSVNSGIAGGRDDSSYGGRDDSSYGGRDDSSLGGRDDSSLGGRDDSSYGGRDDSSSAGGGYVMPGGNLREQKAARIAQNVQGSARSQRQLRIYCWNDEFKNRLRAYYDQYDREASGMTGDVDQKGTYIVGSHEYLKDGTEIIWVTTPNENNAYQDKLDSDLRDQADSDMKVDMFLIEADYAKKYVNGPYVMPIKEVGLTDGDLADQYQYTKDIATDPNGDLEAVTWQSCPGVFAYRRDIARDVLGTDDPTEVQSMLSTWDRFNNVAAAMKEKGYFMLSGYDDSFRTFANNITKSWVDSNYTIQIDDNIWKWVDQTEEYTLKGYNNSYKNKYGMWSDEWYKDQSREGRVFGFFYSTWGVNFTLAGNADYATDLYYVCPGPQAYYWGGTWMCAADGTDNLDTVRDIMKKLTCDTSVMKKITADTQDYTNNAAAMSELSNGFRSEFLGGQNHIAVFNDCAPKIDASLTTVYDQVCREQFQIAFAEYFKGEVDKETALGNFCAAVTRIYPELKIP